MSARSTIGLFLAAWAAGCSNASSGLAPLRNLPCESSDQCERGLVCAANQCVKPQAMQSGPATAYVQMTPPDGSAYVKTQLLDVAIAGQMGALVLTLPQPTSYQVRVFDAAQQEIDAKLTLIGEDRIPGHEIDLVTDLRISNAHTQIARLIHGNYGVLIQRLDQRPSLDTTFMVRSPGGGGDPTTKEFHFNPYRRIFGEVTSSVSSASKLMGVKVSAFSTRTGLPSTSTISDVHGRYAIELPDTTDTEFRLIAVPPEDVLPAWGYQEVVLVGRDGDREKQIPLEPTSDFGKGTARIRVGGEMGREGFMPAAGASVTLTASITEGLNTRVYRLHATTDNDGYVYARDNAPAQHVRLLRAHYLIEVDPGADSPFGRYSGGVDLTAVNPENSPDVQTLLPLKAILRGKVSSDLGRPVPFATVELRRVGDDIDPVQTATDGTGAFEARVEPGDYVLSVLPSSHSDVNEALPVAVSSLAVKDQGESPQPIAVTLPRGVPVFGIVRGETQNEPVPDTRVEFFVEVDGKIVSLGDTRSDAGGQIAIVLPEAQP